MLSGIELHPRWVPLIFSVKIVFVNLTCFLLRSSRFQILDFTKYIYF